MASCGRADGAARGHLRPVDRGRAGRAAGRGRGLGRQPDPRQEGRRQRPVLGWRPVHSRRACSAISAGLRTTLDAHGISFGLTEITEVFGNATGGVKRGAIIEGLTLMSVGVDTGKAFGLQGGIFNVSAFQIHGRGLTHEPAEPGPRQQYRGLSDHPAQRDLVPAELPRRSGRSEDRPAECRPRVHHVRVRRPVPQFGLRLAHAAGRQPALRGPGLPAGDARHPVAPAPDRRDHHPCRRL